MINKESRIRGIQNPLSDQGSNLDFPESKSGVLPVTPSDSLPEILPGTLFFGLANVELIFRIFNPLGKF
jgi:hypothetical protein